METWTFINKKTNRVIRFGLYSGISEHGDEYFLTENDKYYPTWFVDTKEQAENALKKFVHPQYSNYYYMPNTNQINIEDYKIIKFISEV